MKKIFQDKGLFWILAGAFIIRGIGIWYGLPSLYDSDESFNVLNALAYGAKKSLEPTYFVYPSLYSYFLFGIYGLYFMIGIVFGLFPNALEFGASYFIDPTGLFLVGRFLSVILGVASIWLVFKICITFFTRRIAIIAALVLSLSFSHSNLCHWILLESAVVFASALALYFILKADENNTVKSVLGAGFVTGLAISTRYNAGFLIIPLIISAFFTKSTKNSHRFGRTLIALGSCLIGFLVGSPYWIFSFSSFWDTLQYTFSHVSSGMVGHISSIPLGWPFWEIVRVDWLVGLVLVAGLVYAVFSRDKKQLLLLSFAASTLLFVGFWQRTGIHYLMPIYPALAILAAIFLNDIASQKLSRSLKIVIMTAIFLPSFIKILYYDVRLTQSDVRTIAKNWIEANLQDGTSIAYENHVYGPNLFDPGRFFRNTDEAKLLPLELKERLLEEKLRRISYQLVNLRKDFRLRILADREQNNITDPYVRQILETRLPKLQSVRKAGVKYLITSSDNYDRYFKAAAPDKGTATWLSYQNGRNFYQSVFESADLKLLREFQPSFWNLGPTIRVYEFKQSRLEQDEQD